MKLTNSELEKILDELASRCISQPLSVDLRDIEEARLAIQALIDKQVIEAKKSLCNYNCANCHTYNALKAELKGEDK